MFPCLPDIWQAIFDYCSIATLVTCSKSLIFLYNQTANALWWQMLTLLHTFLRTVNVLLLDHEIPADKGSDELLVFLKILKSSGGALIGSVVAPYVRRYGQPRDLNIAICRDNTVKIILYLNSVGYRLRPATVYNRFKSSTQIHLTSSKLLKVPHAVSHCQLLETPDR